VVSRSILCCKAVEERVVDIEGGLPLNPGRIGDGDGSWSGSDELHIDFAGVNFLGTGDPDILTHHCSSSEPWGPANDLAASQVLPCGFLHMPTPKVGFEGNGH